MAEHPYPATVFRLQYSGMSHVDLPEVDAAFPFIQPLVEDSTLIVSGRCHYRNGDPEHNAVIYDEHGQAIRRMVFGDGIEDVQVGLDQRIWVSYFDEGVFGNYGWPSPPMGADGLLCFDMDGQIAWRFHAPGGFDSMADCYALNVTNDAAWVYYYTDFPVIQVTIDGTVRGWENEVAGARALVVDRLRVLLWGGYGEERNRCIVQTIAGEKLVSPQRLNLCLQVLSRRTHDRRSEILADAIDTVTDGRFVHRLLFWPDDELEIVITGISIEKQRQPSREVADDEKPYIEIT